MFAACFSSPPWTRTPGRTAHLRVSPPRLSSVQTPRQPHICEETLRLRRTFKYRSRLARCPHGACRRGRFSCDPPPDRRLGAFKGSSGSRAPPGAVPGPSGPLLRPRVRERTHRGLAPRTSRRTAWPLPEPFCKSALASSLVTCLPYSFLAVCSLQSHAIDACVGPPLRILVCISQVMLANC